MPSAPKKNHKVTKRKGDSGDSDRQKKKPRSGRTINQMFLDDVLYNIPWDDDLSNVPTGLSKEDEASAREMKPDIIEMARSADRANVPVGKYAFIRAFLSAPAPHYLVRLLLR